MDETQGIYRGEVLVMMGALADIYSGTNRILAILEGIDGEDDGEEEEVDS